MLPSPSLFPHVYQEFFQKYDVVTSAPLQFSWSGGVGLYHGAMGLIQKLPLRVYVGVRHQDSDICLEDVLVYIPSQTRWEQKGMESVFGLSVVKKLNAYLRRMCGVSRGMAVGVLIETDWEDINAFFLSLFHSATLFLEGVPPSNYDPHKRIIGTWKLAIACSPDGYIGSSGASIVCGMQSSTYPIIYMLEKRIGNESEKYTRFVHQHINEAEVENYAYRCQPIESLLKGNDGMEMALLSPKSQGRLRIRTSESYSTQFLNDGLFEKLKTEGGEFYALDDTMQQLEFQTGVLHQYSKVVIDAYLGLYAGERKHGFFEALKKFHVLNHLFCFHELPGEHITDEVNELEKVLLDMGISKDAFFFQERIISGNRKILCAAEPGILSSVLNHQNVEIDFASWRDGNASDSVHIEHAPAHGRVHQVLKHLPYSLMIADRVKCIPPSLGEVYGQDADLLVDAVAGKLYLKGEKLSSNEVRTQRILVLVLSACLLRTQVYADELPRLSYTRDRKEFEKKVLGPLQNVVWQRTGKMLPVHVSPYGDTFSVQIGKGDLSIALLYQREFYKNS